MAGDTVITVIGNITGDPELRFTPSGAAVANFTVASTPRQFDRQSNEWKDGETLFMRCSVWRDAAENVAESLQRGTRVIVSGRLKSRSYDTKEGEKRTVMELEVDEVGPSLRYATAKVNKTQRGGAAAAEASPVAAASRVAARVASRRTRGPPARPVAPGWSAGSSGSAPSSPVASRVAAGAAARRPTTSPRSDPDHRYQWPRALSAAAGLVRIWVRNLHRGAHRHTHCLKTRSTPSLGDQGSSAESLSRRRAPRWPSPLCASPRRRPTR